VLSRISSHVLVALLAGAAAATAATQITGRDIKNGTVQLKDLSRAARTALQGQQGPAGPAGPQGPQGEKGDSGTSGLKGADGSNGASGAAGVPGAGLSTSFFGVDTTNPTFSIIGGSSVGSEVSSQVVIPPGGQIAAKEMAASVRASLTQGSIAVTLRVNGADSAVTCTITHPATSCSNGAAAATLNPGDKINVRVVPSGSPTNTVSGTFAVKLVGG
jgi:hypothetical protein